jgi:hypothetical protein
MTGKLACVSMTGNLVRHASRMNNRVSNTAPTYRKYRAKGIGRSVCPVQGSIWQALSELKRQ